MGSTRTLGHALVAVGGATVLALGTVAAASALGDRAEPSAAAPSAAAERGEQDDDWCEGNGRDGNGSDNRRRSSHCRDEDDDQAGPPSGRPGDDGPTARRDRERREHWDVHRRACLDGHCVGISVDGVPRIGVPRVDADVDVDVDALRARVDDAADAVCDAAVIPQYELDVTVRGVRVGPVPVPPNGVRVTVGDADLGVDLDRRACSHVGR